LRGKKQQKKLNQNPVTQNFKKTLNQQENIWKNRKLVGNGFYMTRTDGCGVVYVRPASI
jgi:hypothetical protein